jgi:hypothetical protein
VTCCMSASLLLDWFSLWLSPVPLVGGSGRGLPLRQELVACVFLHCLLRVGGAYVRVGGAYARAVSFLTGESLC